MKRILSDFGYAISRKQFLKQASFFIAFSNFFQSTNKKTNRDNSFNSLSVITYNLFLGSSWPTDRELSFKANQKGQISSRVAMELAIYEPDIIAFSEAPVEPEVQYIADYLNMEYIYFPSAGTNSGSWPGAILTRHEILNSENVPIVGRQRPENLFTRHWGKAQVRLNNGEEIIIHSTHLHHAVGDERRRRYNEITEILNSVRNDIKTGKSILLLGDLNHTPEMEEYKMWMDAGWTDTFAATGIGNGYTRRPDKPSRRIDYIMAHGPIANKVTYSKTLFEGAFRTNPDDPESFALSDHLPVLAEFKF
jgi:endonuclease/exonuclease/phosphatase family metal-dependent hydrolase